MNFLTEPLFTALFETDVPCLITGINKPLFSIVACNKSYRATANLQKSDVAGLPLWDVFDTKRSGGVNTQALRNGLAKAMQTAQKVYMPPFTNHDAWAAENDNLGWCQLVITPIVDADGRATNLMLTINDVTSRIVKHSELDDVQLRAQSLAQELEATNEELAASNEELSSTNEELNTTIEELTESKYSLLDLNNTLEDRIALRIKDLSESEARFRTMIEQSPVAMLVNRGDDLVFETINQPMLDLIDRDAAVMGKPWYEAMPELQGQDVIKHLYHTYRTGQPWTGVEVPIVITRGNKPHLGYYNLSYKALFENGKIVGLLQSATEVTEQVNWRKDLQASEHKFKSMVMTTPIGITVLRTRELIVEIANQQMLDIWNRHMDDVIGNRMIDIFPELVGQPFLPMLVSVIETGKRVVVNEIEAIISTKQGQLKKYYVDFSYDPLFEPDGTVNSLLATVTDITGRVEARKQLEDSEAEQQALNEELTATNEELAAINEEHAATNEELAAANEELVAINEDLDESRRSLSAVLAELAVSEERLRYLLSEAPVAIAVMTGPDLIIESANKKVLQVWGKTEAIIGKPLRIAMPELQGQGFLTLLRGILVTGEPFYGNEVKAQIERGGQIEEIYSNFVYYPLKDDDGQTTSIMMVANVITEQVKAKQELQRAEEMLRFSIEAANVGTWFLNINTLEFIPSARLKEMFGFYADEEVTYDAITAQITDGYDIKINDAIELATTRGQNYSMEHPVIGYRDGKRRWLRAIGKLYPDAEGRLRHLSGLVIDITEQKADELRKNDFIGMVSHELKTPLTTITAIVQMLSLKAKNNNDTFTAGALQKTNTQVKKMANMINGFLNISRLESGKILVEKQTFNLNNLITDIIDETKLTVSSHALTLLPSDIIEVYADSDKIGSVISNLLSNAVKYSPKGNEVKIKCAYVNQTAQISVADQGIGINAHDIDKLFERYYRVENNNTLHISGFGIGLYLSAEIIKRHDGHIWVESEPGVGSTFYFSLPLE
ncbi:PAS domain S-box-containing protein [Mucilaginibacter gracilis]|uniref:histidine kinase n=1 Tax=Mucilaginibacter gracilis TaxID=423350 RepID=A0A495J9Y0_9SPHI|nr:PAS domain-containing protein [Mucilaginibacter gracilis]RKR84869.1 PAS domain S-box-containing protein [Mucilaginibacter gracilis]